MSTTNIQIAAQFRSIRTTIGEAISALMAHELTHRAAGRTAEADAFERERLRLNHRSGELYAKERSALLSGSLAPYVSDITKIRKQATRAKRNIDRINKALEVAGKLLDLLGKLIDLID